MPCSAEIFYDLSEFDILGMAELPAADITASPLWNKAQDTYPADP
ncbi:hypothetical protein JCM12296A_59660 [Desulfosarcina cetonica]